MKEDPDGEKKVLSTLVNHPALPFLQEGLRLVGRFSHRDGGVESLGALEAAMFHHVEPGVCWLPEGVSIGVVAKRGLHSVGEVETIGGHYRFIKQVY